MSFRALTSPGVRLGLLALGVLTTACSSPKPTPTPPPPLQTALWGELKPVVSLKELMRDMIEPAADPLFKSVSIVINKQQGMVEKAPKTDKDWEQIRIGAVTLAEGAYLLKVPRPIAPPEVENKNRPAAAEVSELTPDQILAKLLADPVLWNARIETLRNVGLEYLEIVKRRDPSELWEAAENLDTACENCHLDYWYPGQRALMTKIAERMRQARQQPPAGKR